MIRFGTVPILWNNDDLPDQRGGYRIPFGEILDGIAKSGFQGTELGSDFPRDVEALRRELGARGLTLSGAYFCPGLTDPGRAEAALEPVDTFLAFLEELGATALIVAEPVIPARAAVAGRAAEGPALDGPGWDSLIHSLTELGWRCAGRGLKLAFHNHAGTWIETPEEVDTLLSRTSNERVSLCLDTGHYTFGGGDAATAVRRYLPRLAYLHLKDLDRRVVEAGVDFFEALKRHVFPELGTGCVDVSAIAESLLAAGWSGWVVSEQDTSPLEPCEAATRNRTALERLFSARTTG